MGSFLIMSVCVGGGVEISSEQGKMRMLDLREKTQAKQKFCRWLGQGCCMSPAVFNIFAEKVIEKALQKK